MRNRRPEKEEEEHWEGDLNSSFRPFPCYMCSGVDDKLAVEHHVIIPMQPVHRAEGKRKTEHAILPLVRTQQQEAD